MELYRYERGSSKLALGTFYDVTINLRVFPIIKSTPKGNWIMDFGKRKWVSNNSRKCFAYTTKEAALTNFKKRTDRCRRILKSRMKEAEAFLDAAKLL